MAHIVKILCHSAMQSVDFFDFMIISIAKRWREVRHKGGKLIEIKEEKIQGVLRSEIRR